MNDTPAIIVNIQRQPGANVIEVVDRIKQLLPQLRSVLPSTVDVAVLADRTTTIRASVRDVEFELALAVGLVVLVIFVFLRDAAATVIPSVAVPVSLVGTLGAMYLLGFSLNNLTLMALTISTGFVVDDAIVMIENVARYIEAGDAPKPAALKGSAQIAFTILSLTVSLVAVLIPLLFMRDIAGRLFREFAVTLGVTILISAVVSLTLTPMMCSRLLKQRPAERQGRFYQASQKVFDRIIAAYGRALHRVLAHQGLTLAVATVTLAVTILLFIITPKGFFPTQDTGAVTAVTVGRPSISFDAMTAAQREVARAVLEDPAVDGLASFVGVDGTNPTLSTGRLLINLKPHGERSDTATEVIDRLRDRLGAPRRRWRSTFSRCRTCAGRRRKSSRAQYQYSLEAPDAHLLFDWAPKLVDRLRALPQLTDVSSDQANRTLQSSIAIDRSTAARLGITPQVVDDTLYDAYGQRQISIIFTESNQYRVVLEVARDFSKAPGALNDLYVATGTGAQVPLATVTRASETNGALALDHLGQFPAVTVSFNLAHGVSLGEAIPPRQGGR